MRLFCRPGALRRLSAVFCCAAAGAFLLPAGSAVADDVDITADTTTGVDLDTFSGTTVKVFSGVTVSNTNVAVPAISATAQPWILTNEGTISQSVFGNAVDFAMGGTVTNSGSIDGFNGIWLTNGPGTVTNLAGATIHGEAGAIVCPFSGINPCGYFLTVDNYGDITSDGADTIATSGGAIVTNYAGGLIQSDGSNAVSILFGTTRKVENSGVIRSTAAFAAGISIDPGTVINHAGGEIYGPFNAIWAHSGGPTSVTNDGLLEATEADFAFGVPGSAVELDAGGTVTNTGTIRSSSTNSTDAAIYSAGPTTVTNSGTIASLTGGKAIQFDSTDMHTLNLDTGSVLGGNVVGGSGTDALVLMGEGSEDIGKFLSFETLTMQGDAWSLTGSGGFASSTTIESGRLAVNGTLTTSALTVDPGATLAGTGSIVGAVTADGTVAPGNSIGTISTGSIVFNSGSTYEVEVAANGTSDLTDVSGTATINGGTVSVLTLDPFTAYTDGQQWVIIDTTGGVGGAGFDSVTDDSAFLDFGITYDALQVLLTLSKVADFTSTAETYNQRQTAGALQQLDQTSGSDALAVFNTISMLSAPQSRVAYDAASGELHASLQHALLDVSDLFLSTIARRGGLLAASGSEGGGADGPASLAYMGSPYDALALAGATPTERLAAWIAPMGEAGDVDGDGNAARLKEHVIGIAAGLDWSDRWLDGSFVAGLAAGYTNAEADVTARRSSADFDSGHAGAYAAWDNERLRLAAAAAYAFHAIDTTRRIVFPGVDRTAMADFDGHTLGLHGEGSYRLPLDGFSIAPLATADALFGWRGSGTESGAGALNLTVASEEIQRFTTGLGLGLGRDWTVGPSSVSTELRLLWEHAFGDDTPSQNLTLAGAPGAPFNVRGPERARDWLGVGAGVGIAMGDAATLTARYDGALSAQGSLHQGHLSLGYRF